jgi:hypothetical protein
MAERCYICGEENPNVLEEHHLVPSRFGGSDRDENVATLCRNCHYCVERLYDEQFWTRLADVLRDGDGLDTLGGREFSRPPGALAWDDDGDLVVRDRDKFETYLRVIELRSDGLTWREITEKTGVASSTGHNIYERREVYRRVRDRES